MPKEVGQPGERAAASVTRGLERLDSGPVIVDKTDHAISKFRMAGDLAHELNCPIICPHDENESSISTSAPQREKYPARRDPARNHQESARQPENEHELQSHISQTKDSGPNKQENRRQGRSSADFENLRKLARQPLRDIQSAKHEQVVPHQQKKRESEAVAKLDSHGHGIGQSHFRRQSGHNQSNYD
jgi:hypothetical protein